MTTVPWCFQLLNYYLIDVKMKKTFMSVTKVKDESDPNPINYLGALFLNPRGAVSNSSRSAVPNLRGTVPYFILSNGSLYKMPLFASFVL